MNLAVLKCDMKAEKAETHQKRQLKRCWPDRLPASKSDLNHAVIKILAAIASQTSDKPRFDYSIGPVTNK